MSLENNNYKILYAEDETLTRIYLSKILGKFGDVTQVKDGLEAYKFFQEEKYDLLVTDLSMPHMNGVLLTKKIRSENSDFPIIITTAFREDEEELKNIAYIIKKPINTKKLKELITSIFKDR